VTNPSRAKAQHGDMLPLDDEAEGAKALTPANEMDLLVGRQLKARRKMLSISQKQIGEALGVSFQQVQKYEKGANRIGAGQLQVIAKLLNVGVPYFYADEANAAQRGGFAEDPTSHDVVKILRDPEARELAAAFASLKDPALRRQISDLVQTLTKKQR
jgi:transcriptional regulator with XRE-family HTH domain